MKIKQWIGVPNWRSWDTAKKLKFCEKPFVLHLVVPVSHRLTLSHPLSGTLIHTGMVSLSTNYLESGQQRTVQCGAVLCCLLCHATVPGYLVVAKNK